MRLSSKNICNILGALLLVFLGLTSNAQDYKASIDSTKMLIGNQTLFKIEVFLKDGQKVRFPNLPDTLTPGLEVVSQFASDTSKSDNGRVLITKRYLLTAFDSGNYVVPSIPVLFFNGSNVDTILTQPMQLRVNTVAVDSTKVPLYGIKSNIKAPYTFEEIALVILVILLVMAGIAGTIYYFRRNKQEPIFNFKKKVVEPAHVIAFRELEELQKRKLWQEGHLKQYYSELSDILRRYLDARMGINAMEMTSLEILEALKDATYRNKMMFERMTLTLNISDLVKFAKYVSTPMENDQSAKCIYDFVDDTKELAPKSDDTNDVKAHANSSSNEK